MADSSWQFSIDVGGTFIDVIARRPDGSTVTHKLLSTGVVRGVAGEGSTSTHIFDPQRKGEVIDLWRGYRLRLLQDRKAQQNDEAGWPTSAGGGVHDDRSLLDSYHRFPHVQRTWATQTETIVRASDPVAGVLGLESPIQSDQETNALVGTAYELYSDEPAPVVAIRLLMGTRMDESIGRVDVRLGTTRATNALLERNGARTAFVTTKGFSDALKIGHQDRPDLFALNIIKRDELAECAIEIDERLAADGSVLEPIDEDAVHKQLHDLRSRGVDAIAICLLHAHVNPDHEERVARIAESLGFAQVSVSSRVVRLEGFVSRADTTVADAYLGPVIRNYVERIRISLPEARIKLMTSSGGLVDARQVSGVDTILSGPAGGVIGCRHVLARSASCKGIGFDMGGTSTDVSRLDLTTESLEYQNETVKARVRLRTPMLAIETVAAGGGSICGFDGQKLIVGPASAGAEPGPACYGRGGPLTVSDANLFLGRIASSTFPFPLDPKAVQQRFDLLRDKVAAQTGSTLSNYELAEGFRRIANEHMATAIKRISIQRGYDLRDYALVTFGGAGGQHACALADALNIDRIICHTHAGILSAVGLAAAAVSQIEQRAVDEPLDEGALDRITPVIDELIDSVSKALCRDGMEPSRLDEPRVSLDVRYQGQSTLLTVLSGPVDTMRKSFTGLHEQYYGYVHTDREMEIRVVRVERSAPTHDRPCIEASGPDRGEPASVNRARHATIQDTVAMYVDGTMHDVPLLVRSGLTLGVVITGPAIVSQPTSTIVIEPGWQARVSSEDSIELTRVATKGLVRETDNIGVEVDPIQLELFNRRFGAVAEQMGTTLQRTALSTNVKERLDFSSALFDPEGRLVANAPHIPVHLGGMSDCVQYLLQDVGAPQPGDVYATNDPFRGGSHLNDVTVIAPVYDNAGAQLLFIVASRAHHAEIGGIRPGSMASDAKSLAEEGVLIRALRIKHGGASNVAALLDLLTTAPYPSRAPDENIADIEAQIAANRSGERALKSLVDQYGLPVVHGYMGHIRAAAEQKTRAAIRTMSNGVRRFEDRMDDGTTIRLKLTINDDRAIFDFTGTDPVHRGNLNANPSIVRSAILYCLRCLIGEDIPLNGGMLAPIKIVLPECFLNPPNREASQECAAVGGGNVETSQRIVDVIFKALGVAAASQGTMNNLLIGNERFGYYETICGGSGAGPGFDGADAVHSHMTNTRLTDPEVLESRYPVRLLRFAIRIGSGGAGERHGGCGVVRELEFLEPLSLSLLTQRRSVAPYGLEGGSNGAPGRNLLRRAGSDGSIELGPIESIDVGVGDRLILETPGGGGWGRNSSARS